MYKHILQYNITLDVIINASTIHGYIYAWLLDTDTLLKGNKGTKWSVAMGFVDEYVQLLKETGIRNTLYNCRLRFIGLVTTM